MRRANTTFVNLRSALDDVDPLVDAAKPVARAARALPRPGAPVRPRQTSRRSATSRDDQAPGPNNDLIELIKSFPPLAHVAMDTPARERRRPPRRVPGDPTDALNAAAPTIAFGRPYTPDFVGWMDDFSTTGGYDALGGYSRAWINLSEIL